MAVHPFARKAEALLERLKALRESLRAARKAAKSAGDKVKRPRNVGKLSDIPVTWLLGSGEMEQQAFAQGSARGINQNFDKAQSRGKKTKQQSSGDRTLDALNSRYQQEMDKCRRKNLSDNEAYFRCRAKRGSSAESCRSLFVPMTCPNGDAARRAIDEYVKQRDANKPGNSGGGAGGGF